MPRIVRTLLLALTLTLFGGAAARADTITVTTGPDPTEEVPLPITATWSSGTSAEVFVTVKPAGPVGCAATYAIDDPSSSDEIYRGGSTATGTVTHNDTFSDPGTWTLCGYLQDGPSASSARAVTGPISLTIRSARATVSLAPPARVGANQKFALNVPVTAELARELFVTIKPVGGRGCEATYALDDPNSSDVIYRSGVQGATTVTTNYTASATQGTYLLCAYVQEGPSDATPEATSSATFIVGPDPCVTAKTALTKAQKSVSTAEASVTRNRNAYNKYKKAAKRAHGARHKSLQKKAKTYRSRYTSAVHTRSKARAKLATAQSAVDSACA